MYITQEKNLDGLDSTFTQLKDCHVEELNLFWEASEADLEVQESVGERGILWLKNYLKMEVLLQEKICHH